VSKLPETSIRILQQVFKRGGKHISGQAALSWLRLAAITADLCYSRSQ